LDAYLDGDLAPGERWRFAAHLDECPNCREAVGEQQWIDDLLRAPAIAQREMPSPALVESVRAALARRFRYWRVAAVGAAAAAAVALIVWGWSVTPNRPAVGPRMIHVASDRGATPQEMAASPAPPSSMFVSNSAVIVMPVASRSPDVTIVRVYPVFEPQLTAEASVDDFSAPAELARPDFSRGG
jgi:predicted anti-sigma-YlaC factor YlaD